MTTFKECNYRCEKSNEAARVMVSYQTTLEAAVAWVGSAERYLITDCRIEGKEILVKERGSASFKREYTTDKQEGIKYA